MQLDSNLQIETLPGVPISLRTLRWNYLRGADFPAGCAISLVSSPHPCHQDILSFWTSSSAVRVGRTSAPSDLPLPPLGGPTMFPVILTSSPAGLRAHLYFLVTYCENKLIFPEKSPPHTHTHQPNPLSLWKSAPNPCSLKPRAWSWGSHSLLTPCWISH